MSSSLVSGRSAPRLHRGLPWLLFSLATLLSCATAGPPPPPPKNDLLEVREIHGGEIQEYPVEIQAGQFLRVLVEEDGIDVGVRLLDPNGNEMTGADSLCLTCGHEEEDLAAIAVTPGLHHLKVTASRHPDLGHYRLKIEGPRDASPTDRLRAQAVQAMWSGLGPEPNTAEEARRQIAGLEPALPLWQQLGDDRRSAQALFGLGRARFTLADYSRSADDFLRSASFWERQVTREAKGWRVQCLNSAGRSLRRADRRQEARKSYGEALALARELGDDAQQAASLTNLGNLDDDEGELLRGIERQLEALDRVRQAGDRSREATILNNLAFTYGRLGEHQKALKYFQESLALARSLHKETEEATALNNLADIYGSLGDWKSALEYYQNALELNRATGNRANEAKTLSNLGVTYQHLDRFDEAWASLSQAVELGRTVNDVESQFFGLSNQAFLALRQKQPEKAIELAQQALPLTRGLREREANLLLVQGSAHREMGELKAAREELEKALSLSRARGDRGSEAQASLALARVDRERGDPEAARTRIEGAIEIIESLRAKVVSPELRASFLAAKQDYYELQIDTLMTLHGTRKTEGFAAEALRVSERARARSLLDILQEAEADIRQGADPLLIERERQLREAVNARELYRLDLLADEKPDETKLEEAERKLEDALQEYQQVQDQLRESSPRYAALTQPQPLSVAEIQRQVLEGGSLLLEYALGEKRSFLWAVGSDSLASFELPARDRIEKAARRYYELLTARNNPSPRETSEAYRSRVKKADLDAWQAARDLSLLILKPVESLLGDRSLLIVADGALQYIPFAALPITSASARLASRHEVVSLPSASALAVLRGELRDRQAATQALAIFADPVFQKDDKRMMQKSLGKMDPTKLPQVPAIHRGMRESREKEIDLSDFRRLVSSGREADKIAALLSSQEVWKATGFEASRDAVVNGGLERFKNVHFATHGVLDSEHPDLSGLVLSRYNERGEEQNGFLRLNDIYNLRLAADLVVLSACKTALGKEIRGEGLVGLTRGFMYAGAQRVLASLWSVEDLSTAELMESFYRHMLRDRLSPAAALRKAQLEMEAKPGRQSPYYWAGFSLQGEWR